MRSARVLAPTQGKVKATRQFFSETAVASFPDVGNQVDQPNAAMMAGIASSIVRIGVVWKSIHC